MGSVGGTAGTAEIGGAAGGAGKGYSASGVPSVLAMGFSPDGVFSYVTTTLFGDVPTTTEPEQEDEIADDAEADAKKRKQLQL